MFEKKFGMIEGETFQLKELGTEIESIVGSKLKDISGEVTRIVGQKPNPENRLELFNIRFRLSDAPDFVDAVVTTGKKEQWSDYDFAQETLTVDLVSYHHMSRPTDNYYDQAEE